MSTEPIHSLPPIAATPPRLAVVASQRTAKLAESEHPPADQRAVQLAVEALNQHLASSRTDLKFELDRDSNRIVVSVVDVQNGKVLRQIPSEEALRIARYLEHDRLGLVRQRA